MEWEEEGEEEPDGDVEDEEVCPPQPSSKGKSNKTVFFIATSPRCQLFLSGG